MSHEIESSDNSAEEPSNNYEKFGRFVVGSALGATGGVIGATLLWKAGISFEAPQESAIIIGPAVVCGISLMRKDFED